MEQVLEKLFESPAKIKMLRIFTQNPEAQFSFPELVKKSQVTPRAAKRELEKLARIGFINKKTARKATLYTANPSFPLLRDLSALLIKSAGLSRKTLTSRLKSVGGVALAVISGIFIQNEIARTDLLVVGNRVKKAKFDRFLSSIESEFGKPIRYTLMEKEEFKYRMDMYDRFLRDIFEFPHEKLINKIRI